MLKAMFREIQARLGDEYALFSEFNPQMFKNEEFLAKYKNVGVLYVNNGNLGKMPDGAMMEIDYTLELFMRVDENVNISDIITEPMEDLATGTSGKLYLNGKEAGEFFLDAGLPTSDGTIVEGADDHNYIRYQMPISVVFTNGITIAGNEDVSIEIDGVSYPLQSVLSVVEVPQVQLETDAFINAAGGGATMRNESTVVSAGWSIQINKLYRPDDDAKIRECILNTPDKAVVITYKGVAHSVVMHDCTFAAELGQAEVMTINASAAMRSV